MNAFLAIILTVLSMVAILFLLGLLVAGYRLMRTKLNKPRIGKWCFLCDLLESDDYVSIDGKVRRFSHITRPDEVIDSIRIPSDDNKTLGGELAFWGNGINYYMYHVSVLDKCEFVYGKYGVKWALTEYFASIAKQKVEESIYK